MKIVNIFATLLLLSAAIVLQGCGNKSGGTSIDSRYSSVCTNLASGVRLLSISPTTGPQFGDQQVTAVISGVGPGFTTATVYLGNKARWVTATRQSNSTMTITFTTAGTPTAGTYPLVMANSLSTCAYLANAYTYRPPVDSAFKTFVAVGASYTAGFQSDSYNEIAQLNGPATWVARQAGAYFPIPLIKMPGIPPDLGLAGLDTTGGYTLDTSNIAQAVVNALIDPQTQTMDIPRNFEDTSILPYNIAVPGATIENEVTGPASVTSRGLGTIVLSNILFAPQDNSIFETKDIKSEIQMAEDLHPTIIMSTDLYGNDLVTDNTTLSDFTFYITQAVSAFASTGAQVFLADVPHISMFPSNQQGALNQLAACGETFGTVSLQTLDQAASASNSYDCSTFTTDTCQKNACSAFASTNQRIDQFNAEFKQVVAQYPNVHIVPFDELVNGQLSLSGQKITFDAHGFPEYIVAGIPLSMSHLGGFYSLDDLHLTNTGYAILASIFVQQINQTLGTNVPLPDLPSILAGDPLSPPAISDYCSQRGNGQKLFCQCISGNYLSVTTFTCSTILY